MISKQTIDKVLNYLQDRPVLVKILANTVTLAASLAAPFNLLASLFKKKHKDLEGYVLTKGARALKEKLNKYVANYSKYTDQSGFIMTAECDSVLFSGLMSAVGLEVDMLQARDKEGRWYRRPLYCEPCYPCHSKSTISRDMFIGILWHLWHRKDLKTAQELFAYGKKNHWIMGEGDPSRTYMTPGLQATLAEIVYRLGGENHLIKRNLPQSWPDNLTDYQAHLHILHLLLRGDVMGHIDSTMKKSTEKYKYENPNNPLMVFAYEKYHSDILFVGDLLLEDILWPDSGICTNRDRKEEWVLQRSQFFNPNTENPDWLPDLSGEEKPHSGADFIFITKYIFGNILHLVEKDITFEEGDEKESPWDL